jgi:aminoglycoside phosphotransferase (APT) family kinase protein
MDEQLSTAVDAAFPERTVADIEAPGPSWNDRNRTVRLVFADGDTAYLKLAADGDGTRLVRERAVIQYVDRSLDVSVPTIVAADPEHAVPYLATAAVPGDRLLQLWAQGDGEERERLIAAAGRTFAELHSERFGTHGYIVGGGPAGLELDTGQWTDVLGSQIELTREIAPAERFPEHFDAVIEVVESNRELLNQASAALLHGDPAHPNGFRSGEQVGLLDWEMSHVGDPARELHRARRQLLGSQYFDVQDRLVTVFLDAYRATAGSLPSGFEERRAVYDAVGYLGRTTFFSKWAPDSDRPEAELAAAVAAEMERRLEAAR